MVHADFRTEYIAHGWPQARTRRHRRRGGADGHCGARVLCPIVVNYFARLRGGGIVALSLRKLHHVCTCPAALGGLYAEVVVEGHGWPPS